MSSQIVSDKKSRFTEEIDGQDQTQPIQNPKDKPNVHQ